MPDQQPSPDTPDRAKHATDGTVLDLLIYADGQRPWSLHELALEIGDEDHHRRPCREPAGRWTRPQD
jgi:hypothetical protein